MANLNINIAWPYAKVLMIKTRITHSLCHSGGILRQIACAQHLNRVRPLSFASLFSRRRKVLWDCTILFDRCHCMGLKMAILGLLEAWTAYTLHNVACLIQAMQNLVAYLWIQDISIAFGWHMLLNRHFGFKSKNYYNIKGNCYAWHYEPVVSALYFLGMRLWIWVHISWYGQGKDCSIGRTPK